MDTPGPDFIADNNGVDHEVDPGQPLSEAAEPVDDPATTAAKAERKQIADTRNAEESKKRLYGTLVATVLTVGAYVYIYAKSHVFFQLFIYPNLFGIGPLGIIGALLLLWFTVPARQDITSMSAEEYGVMVKPATSISLSDFRAIIWLALLGSLFITLFLYFPSLGTIRHRAIQDCARTVSPPGWDSMTACMHQKGFDDYFPGEE